MFRQLTVKSSKNRKQENYGMLWSVDDAHLLFIARNLIIQTQNSQKTLSSTGITVIFWEPLIYVSPFFAIKKCMIYLFVTHYHLKVTPLPLLDLQSHKCIEITSLGLHKFLLKFRKGSFQLNHPRKDFTIRIDGIGYGQILFETFEFEARRAGDDLGGAETAWKMRYMLRRRLILADIRICQSNYYTAGTITPICSQHANQKAAEKKGDYGPCIRSRQGIAAAISKCILRPAGIFWGESPWKHFSTFCKKNAQFCSLRAQFISPRCEEVEADEQQPRGDFQISTSGSINLQNQPHSKHYSPQHSRNRVDRLGRLSAD